MNINQAIDEFVTYKRSLGMRYQSPEVRLKAFSNGLSHDALENVTPEEVKAFLEPHKHSPSYWLDKYSALSIFFRYAQSRGYVVKDVLPRSVLKQDRSFRPYIYSVEDMQKLLQVVDKRYRGTWHMELYTVRVLLLLLYATGLRISEAVNLTQGDVSLEEATLTIRETKFFKTRLVPIGPELADILTIYVQRKWKEKKPKPDCPFLATCHDQPVTRQTAELTFKRIRAEAKVARNDGAKFQPRLHDFRHTFAVTRLISWYREGKNVQRLLPHLSTYLGHVRLQETTRYLTLTAELLKQANCLFEQYAKPGDGQ